MNMATRTDLDGSTRVERRILGSPASESAEIYLTVSPLAGSGLETRARHLYTAIRDELRDADARILSERTFATPESFSTLDAIRAGIYSELDDGVAPTRVAVAPSPAGAFVGVQVHAVHSDSRPRAIRCWDMIGGSAARVFEREGQKWLFVNGLKGAAGADEGEEARRMFFCTGCFLRQAGGSMSSVARTWLWLKDICGWYDDLNAARTTFFERSGLIDREARSARLPASTGIGLYVPGDSACTLDLIALPGREDQIRFIDHGGDQRSAFEYGSAFSRAAVVPMPGGKTVFVSGTAAIDETGRTEHVGQIEAQIEATIAHLRSLLAELDCRDEHILTALAYCKNEDVRRSFRENWPGLNWPCLTMIGDVCRPDLLFEIELAASPELLV